MPKKKLPKKIFVHREGEGEDEYLMINEDIQDAADMFSTKLVGTYRLEATSIVTGIAKIE